MKRRKRQKRKRWEQLSFPSLLLVPSKEVETAQENPAPSIAKSAGHTLAWVQLQRHEAQSIEDHERMQREQNALLEKFPVLREKLDVVAVISKEIRDSRNAYDMEVAWNSIRQDVTDETKRADLVAQWNEQAVKLGFSEGTLKDLGEKGVGPCVDQQPKKRRKSMRKARVVEGGAS